jgi:hypothetical protein
VVLLYPCVVVACLCVWFQPLSESITSLHDAAKWGDLEAAERLLNEGADVNGVVSAQPGGGGYGGRGGRGAVGNRETAQRES